jgi:hypothetical protein
MSKESAEHHTKAPEHHEHAARHHREAAKHYGAGNHEKAAHHAHVAHGHHLHAEHHEEEAAKHHVEEHGSKQVYRIAFGAACRVASNYSASDVFVFPGSADSRKLAKANSELLLRRVAVRTPCRFVKEVYPEIY